MCVIWCTQATMCHHISPSTKLYPDPTSKCANRPPKKNTNDPRAFCDKPTWRFLHPVPELCENCLSAFSALQTSLDAILNDRFRKIHHACRPSSRRREDEVQLSSLAHIMQQYCEVQYHALLSASGRKRYKHLGPYHPGYQTLRRRIRRIETVKEHFVGSSCVVEEGRLDDKHDYENYTEKGNKETEKLFYKSAFMSAVGLAGSEVCDDVAETGLRDFLRLALDPDSVGWRRHLGNVRGMGEEQVLDYTDSLFRDLWSMR